MLTGSLLRFLPGAALVAGMRDLIDQSIISGSARLAEALFLGAAVAGGTAIGISLANQFGVPLEVAAPITEGSQIPLQVAAAGIACGAWAVRLGEPRFALLTASLLGALGWAVFLLVSPLGDRKRRRPRRSRAWPSAPVAASSRGAPMHRSCCGSCRPPCRCCPACSSSTGCLRRTRSTACSSCPTAVATALALGAAIAFGDIVVQTVRQVREEIIDPVIVQPVTHVVQTRIRAVIRSRSNHDADRDSPDR